MRRIMRAVALATFVLVIGCGPDAPLEIVAKYDDLNVQVSEHGEGVYVFHRATGTFSTVEFADALGRFKGKNPTLSVTSASIIYGHGDSSGVDEILVLTEEKQIQSEKGE